MRHPIFADLTRSRLLGMGEAVLNVAALLLLSRFASLILCDGVASYRDVVDLVMARDQPDLRYLEVALTSPWKHAFTCRLMEDPASAMLGVLCGTVAAFPTAAVFLVLTAVITGMRIRQRLRRSQRLVFAALFLALMLALSFWLSRSGGSLMGARSEGMSSESTLPVKRTSD